MTGQLDATWQGQVAVRSEEEKHAYIHMYICTSGRRAARRQSVPQHIPWPNLLFGHVMP